MELRKEIVLMAVTGVTALCVLAVYGVEERGRLYTDIDPSSPGGVEGKISDPVDPIRQILAIPPDEPGSVYKGEISGDGTEFRFTGLPMRKYDLVVIYEDSVYEGTQLNRGESTLTEEDLAGIEASIQKSEPYFKTKIVHRVEGVTGDGSLARCFCTYYRDEGEKVRRTFKLVMLKDVGVGWQIVRARDLYPLWTNPDLMEVPHRHSEVLAGVRVADSVKDLGELNLKE